MHPPHVAQRLHHRHFPSCGWRGQDVQRVKQTEPIRADFKRQRLTLLLAFGEAVILDAVSISFEPGRLCDRAQPVGHDGGKIIKRRAQCVSNQLQRMQIVHGCQHVCAVGALLAARPDQTTFLKRSSIVSSSRCSA